MTQSTKKYVVQRVAVFEKPVVVITEAFLPVELFWLEDICVAKHDQHERLAFWQKESSLWMVPDASTAMLVNGHPAQSVQIPTDGVVVDIQSDLVIVHTEGIAYLYLTSRIPRAALIVLTKARHAATPESAAVRCFQTRSGAQDLEPLSYAIYLKMLAEE